MGSGSNSPSKITNKFMDEIMWYINFYLGDRIGAWILPNPNPSARARFSQSLTNAYVASGIVKVLVKVFDEG